MIAKALKEIDEAIAAGDTEEIILDNIEFGEITAELKKKLEAVENLEMLSISQCKLKSLANFPNLPNLLRLELIENEFPAADLKHLTQLADLQSLSLSSNDIKTVDDLKVLAELPISQLDLSDTPLAGQADYREQVFKVFKDLQILDNADQVGNEVEYEDDEFDGTDGEEGDFEDAEDDEEDDGEDFDDEEEGDDDEEEEDDDEDDEDEPRNKRTKK